MDHDYIRKPLANKSRNTKYCCIPQCSTYGDSGISFHLFPKDKIKKKNWETALRIGKPISPAMRVCSHHFQASNYFSKQEQDQFTSQSKCPTCLSVGRKMYSLQVYSDIFENIMSSVVELDMKSNSYNICWECFGFLRNVRRFQKKACSAQKLLDNKQHSKTYSLSTLYAVTANDIIVSSHSFPNTQDSHTRIIIKTKDATEENSSTSDHETEDLGKISVDLTEMNPFKGRQINKADKTRSKWAQKHSLQKRKRKFKIFHNSNNLHLNFRRLYESEVDKSLYVEIEKKLDKNCSSISEEGCIIKEKSSNQAQLRNFICDICEYSTKTKHNLIRHINKHYYKYECKWCDFIGHKLDDVKYHLDKHKQLIKCLKCGFICGSMQEFSEHYKDWHEKYICHYCGVTFKMRYCIKDHIKKRHSPYKCNTCSKEFKRYNALWLHNKICHSTVQTRTYCNVCDKYFVDIYRYKWHLANSVQHKPKKKVKVPCPDCSKVFTKNIYMKDHYNLVHLKVFKYRCQDCDKNFIRNADLLKHNRRVHEGILPPKDKICHFCGRGFTTNKILSNHVRTHGSTTKSSRQEE